MNQSVLNTDAFDRRRFERLFEMSEKMQELERKGRNMFPSFRPLMGDLWAGLFKMKPEIRNEVPDMLYMNKQLMKRVMSDENFQEFREFTRLDDLASALGTMKHSETVLKWIEEQSMHNEELKQALRKALSGDGGAIHQAAKAMQQAIEQNGDALTQALASAAKEARQMKDSVKSLLGGIGAGNEEAELKKVPLRDQLLLADKLSKDHKLREIAMWAGRMKLIAQKKKRSKYRKSIDRSGITIGSQIEKLLPQELAAFSSPYTKLDFLRRFAEGQTLQFDTQGNEQLGKGPIVLCLDQSGSMGDYDSISKGFTLALMSIARRKRRDFALILFSNHASDPVIYPKGKITTQDMIELASTFLSGGTNFESPLLKAAEVIEKSRFKEADLIFVTDGEDQLGEGFLNWWNDTKAINDFRVISLLIGTEYEDTAKQFSDRVVKASSFTDEAVQEVFEI